MPLTDSESSESPCGLSSLNEIEDVGIFQIYPNEPLAHKSDESGSNFR